MATLIPPGLVCGVSQWNAWEAVARFRWDGSRGMSVSMEDEAPPCGSERGYAPITYGVISRLKRLNMFNDSSVIIVLGDVLPDHKLHWSVRAEPCLVKAVVFSKISDWHCAILAPTPMEVHFESGRGYIKQAVDQVARDSRPWASLSSQIFWRGAHHRPQSCARLLGDEEKDPRGHVVKLAETVSFLNASFDQVPRSVFLDHRYLLDIGGSACTTCALLPLAAHAAQASWSSMQHTCSPHTTHSNLALSILSGGTR